MKQCERSKDTINQLRYEIRQMRKKLSVLEQQNSNNVVPLNIIFTQLDQSHAAMKNFCQLLSLRDVVAFSSTCKYFRNRITGRINTQSSVLSSLIIDLLAIKRSELIVFEDTLKIFRWRDTKDLRDLILQNGDYSFYRDRGCLTLRFASRLF